MLKQRRIGLTSAGMKYDVLQPQRKSRMLGEPTAKHFLPHIRHCNRWVAAASSLILILAALLVFIPESRAFAVQMYYSIVRLFDNRVEIQQPTQTHTSREYDSQTADDFASELEQEHPQKQEMQTFATLQEFEKATGHIPYRLNASGVTYETSKYQKNRRNEEWLYTYYAYEEAFNCHRHRFGISLRALMF